MAPEAAAAEAIDRGRGRLVMNLDLLEGALGCSRREELFLHFGFNLR